MPLKYDSMFIVQSDLHSYCWGTQRGAWDYTQKKVRDGRRRRARRSRHRGVHFEDAIGWGIIASTCIAYIFIRSYQGSWIDFCNKDGTPPPRQYDCVGLFVELHRVVLSFARKFDEMNTGWPSCLLAGFLINLVFLANHCIFNFVWSVVLSTIEYAHVLICLFFHMPVALSFVVCWWGGSVEKVRNTQNPSI